MLKTIDIYEVGEIGQNKGLIISDENYIKTISKNMKHDEIKTRLYLYGKDNISIHSINITGQPYIENYDYYKQIKYMSQSLIDALDAYETKIDSKRGEFSGYLDQLETLNTQLDTKNNELFILETELKVIEQNIDIAIADGGSIGSLNTQKTAKEAEIATKESEIDALETQADAVYTNMSTLRNTIDLENNFTVDQIDELDSFIREEVFSDGNYTEYNIQELLADGIKKLNTISQPPIEFEIDVVDFLNLVECQHDWYKLIQGDIVNIVHEGLGVNIEVRLVAYTHEVDSNSLTLKFSNRNYLDDPNYYERDLLEDLKTTGTTVDFSRFKWDKAETAQLAIAQYVSSQLDLSKQAILKAQGQKPILDERGIWLYKLDEDGSINNQQIRLVNNIIVLTNDNWNTVTWALDSSGLNAEILRGKLGQFATVRANQIVVSDDGQKIPDDLIENAQEWNGAVKQGEPYNYVTITPEEGVVATHGDGSKTVLDGDGFKRKILSNGHVYSYINLSCSGSFMTTGTYEHTGSEAFPITLKTTAELDALNVGISWITLPNLDFMNRNFVVIPSILDLGTIFTGTAGASYETTWNHYMKTEVAILEYDYPNARFKIRARIAELASYRGSYMMESWRPLNMAYYAFATT
jgi:hypothetical protein